ncbi:unnamed protein product [Symbiodinium sp. KB8]|nr:unnamed protein product [Symbiodinium sp. KB8]
MDTAVQTRERKILELTDLVYASLDLEYVRTTGSLFASKSLRHSATRQQMSFMKNFEYEGRLLTEKVTTRVVKNLLDSKSLEIPTCTPGYSKRKWVKDSAQLLLSLLQKARRSYSAMGTMDTQPWQLDETEDPNKDWVWKDDYGWIRKELAADDHREPADPDHEDPVEWPDKNYDMDSDGKEWTRSWNDPKPLKIEGEDAEAWDDHDDHGRAEQAGSIEILDDDMGAGTKAGWELYLASETHAPGWTKDHEYAEESHGCGDAKEVDSKSDVTIYFDPSSVSEWTEGPLVEDAKEDHWYEAEEEHNEDEWYESKDDWDEDDCKNNDPEDGEEDGVEFVEAKEAEDPEECWEDRPNASWRSFLGLEPKEETKALPDGSDRVMPAENDDWDKDCRQLFWDGFIMAGTLARTGGPKAKPFLAGTRWGLSLIID